MLSQPSYLTSKHIALSLPRLQLVPAVKPLMDILLKAKALTMRGKYGLATISLPRSMPRKRADEMVDAIVEHLMPQVSIVHHTCML